MRLDVALLARHPELSRRRAREVIEKGQVRVGGQTVQEPGLEVAADAALDWDPNRPARRHVRCSLPLLYSDEHLVVVDKPAGLLSVPTPGAGREDTVLSRVREYAERLHAGRAYAGAVHRLDRDTTGALAVALSRPVHEAMAELFRAHDLERRYLALVAGALAADSGQIDAPIHDAYVSGRRRVAHPGELSRAALTHWKVVERFPAACLLEVKLETGRQHQIRLHLSHLGLPILGEPVYRPAELPRRLRVNASRPMLHARLLAFVQPLSGARVRAESPLPEDFERLLARLRRLR